MAARRRPNRKTQVRQACVRADVVFLADALSDTHLSVRRSAAYYLGELRDPAGVAPLCRYLEGGNNEFRILALKALAKIGDPVAAPLLYAIASSDDAFGVRATAMAALGTVGDHRAIPLVQSIVADPNLHDHESLPQRDGDSYRRWAAAQLADLNLRRRALSSPSPGRFHPGAFGCQNSVHAADQADLQAEPSFGTRHPQAALTGRCNLAHGQSRALPSCVANSSKEVHRPDPPEAAAAEPPSGRRSAAPAPRQSAEQAPSITRRQPAHLPRRRR